MTEFFNVDTDPNQTLFPPVLYPPDPVPRQTYSWMRILAGGPSVFSGTVDFKGEIRDKDNKVIKGISVLNDLDDVTSVSTPPVNHVLTFDGANWNNQAPGASGTILVNACSNDPMKFRTAGAQPTAANGVVFLDGLNSNVGKPDGAGFIRIWKQNVNGLDIAWLANLVASDKLFFRRQSTVVSPDSNNIVTLAAPLVDVGTYFEAAPGFTVDNTDGTSLMNDESMSICYVKASGGGASALNDLTDVTIAGPVNGQVLTYNAGVWNNLVVPAPVLQVGTLAVSNSAVVTALASNLTEVNVVTASIGFISSDFGATGNTWEIEYTGAGGTFEYTLSVAGYTSTVGQNDRVVEYDIAVNGTPQDFQIVNYALNNQSSPEGMSSLTNVGLSLATNDIVTIVVRGNDPSFSYPVDLVVKEAFLTMKQVA